MGKIQCTRKIKIEIAWLYEIENRDNPNLVTISTNPILLIKSIKALKNTPSMNFEAYSDEFCSPKKTKRITQKAISNY